MKLEIGSFNIKEVAFGGRTQVTGSTLLIDKGALRQYILEDSHFRDVQVDLAKPGESVRIVHVMDVVEPRYKVSGPGTVFPGHLGPPFTVGESTTHRLAGVAVVAVSEPVPGEPIYWREAIIDMCGPGARYTPFGSTINLVLDFVPKEDLFQDVEVKNVMLGSLATQDYIKAVKVAGLRAAAFLAQVTSDQRPHETETFHLGPCDPSLLRVGCVYQYRPDVYGFGSMDQPVAHLLHPNESFDGAITTIGLSGASNREATYMHQNNELLLELCRRHGVELNFVGYSVYGGLAMKNEEKERISTQVCQMMRQLGAQAVVMAPGGGVSESNLSVEFMLLCQKLERSGIKTTMLFTDNGSGVDDPGLIFFVPEADAIVITGSRDQPFRYPKVQRVLGGTHILATELLADGELDLTLRYLYGASNKLMANRVRTLLR